MDKLIIKTNVDIATTNNKANARTLNAFSSSSGKNTACSYLRVDVITIIFTIARKTAYSPNNPGE